MNDKIVGMAIDNLSGVLAEITAKIIATTPTAFQALCDSLQLRAVIDLTQSFVLVLFWLVLLLGVQFARKKILPNIKNEYDKAPLVGAFTVASIMIGLITVMSALQLFTDTNLWITAINPKAAVILNIYDKTLHAVD